MQMKVNLFAALKEHAGSGEIFLPWKRGMTYVELLEDLKKTFHSMESLLVRSFVAVNGACAEPDQLLMPEDEVAVLPPVSGG